MSDARPRATSRVQRREICATSAQNRGNQQATMRATDCVTLAASGRASCAGIARSGAQHRATICASSNLRSRNHAPGSGQYRPPCAASAQVIVHAYACGKRAPQCAAAPRPTQPKFCCFDLKNLRFDTIWQQLIEGSEP
ncbi:chromatin structure-remodeling complex protein SYD-like [Dorcoceras hygrometricum]|uniref:Chromatin structure-remodeling complex protein SYD-like n=1 Tax=Dorcoceras hygrometricum TaxID=472368 RepID=A0A2Z7ABA2_9LAMI|nr:chromatin structure-remodeling complex protein SYD-like [Dorcoceras hygrometricum]